MTIQSDLERIEELKILLKSMDNFYDSESPYTSVILGRENQPGYLIDNIHFPKLRDLLIDTAKEYLQSEITRLKKSLYESNGE